MRVQAKRVDGMCQVFSKSRGFNRAAFEEVFKETPIKWSRADAWRWVAEFIRGSLMPSAASKPQKSERQ